LRLHILGQTEPASEEKPQTDGVTDAGPTAAESTRASDLPSDNKATATAFAGGLDESTTEHHDSTEAAEHSSAKVENIAVDKPSEEARDTAATNQDEHDDHIVEGEEDTVIY
jgi:hypothetical protein